MNTKAAHFASLFVAVVAFFSSIFVFTTMDMISGFLTILFGIAWIGVGYYFKNSGETENKSSKKSPNKQNHRKSKK